MWQGPSVTDPMRDFEAEIVNDPAQLKAVEDDWRKLAEQRGNAFITPEWFFAWFAHFGDEHQSVVSVVRRPDGRLAGVMPLVLSMSKRPRVLSFAGANLGDNFHPAALEANENVVAAATALALDRERKMWSSAVFDNVEVTASWPEHFIDSSPSRLTIMKLRTNVLPYILLEGQSWEDFQQVRRRKTRRERGRKLRRLKQEHEVRFRCTDIAEVLTDDMATLFRLHDLRRDQFGDSTLASKRVRAFLHDFAAAALGRGWLRLWFLEVDGRPVAANYSWCLGGRYACYQSGFDPALSRHNVGGLLEDRELRAAIDEGAKMFDLLLGDEDYKLKQATSVRRVHTLAAVRSRHPARLLIAAKLSLRRVFRALPVRLHERIRKP